MIQDNQDFLTIKEYIFLVFGLMGMMIYRLLGWIMPKTAFLFWDGIKSKISDWVIELNKKEIELQEKVVKKELSQYKKEVSIQMQEQRNEIKSLSNKMDELLEAVSTYRMEKHNIEGEFLEMKDAIVNQDKDKMNLLKEIYKNK